MNKEELYKRAIRLWGVDAQIDMMIEECAELIQALQKYKRNPTLATVDNIHEELADVEIMSEQMRGIYGSYAVDSMKEQKIKRLEDAINKEA